LSNTPLFIRFTQFLSLGDFHFSMTAPLMVFPEQTAAAGDWLPMICDQSCFIDGGWFLVRGRIHCEGSRERTLLKVCYQDRQTEILTLPVSRRGNLLELIKLQAGVEQLWLQPSSGQGNCRISAVTFRRVGWGERQWRQMQRVLPMYRQRSRKERLRLGLYGWSWLLDLPRAYHLAGQLRDDRPLLGYAAWLARFDGLTVPDRNRILRQIARWSSPPLLHIHLLTGQDEQALLTTLKSLSGQLYRRFEVYAPTAPEGDWPFVIHPEPTGAIPGWHLLLPAGGNLPEQALYWFAHEVMANPECQWIYSDHDCLNAEGERHSPHFKPDWSPTLLQAQNYIGWSALWYQAAATPLPRDEHECHRLWLRLGASLKASEIRHIPALLMQVSEMVRLEAPKLCPVTAHHAEFDSGARVERLTHELCRVIWPLPRQLPLVSIIIPTRNGLDHLRPCLESLFERTRYPRFEVLVVDNQSDEPATLAFLEAQSVRHGVHVIPFDKPFNYSAINNLAVSQASGELICLLNNDTEVISPDWLDEMVAQLLRERVGAVGAKLYYSDGRVQHGGDAVGPGGCADHLHSRLAADDPGYCQRALCAQELSAVTAACLLTRKTLFLELGGLDEHNLPVAFNDVDYCLRVREAGWQVVWTPHAELYHHESVSRGKDVTPAQQARGQRELQ